MLGKLIKYEFKATARIFGVLYLVLLIFALVNSFTIAGMDSGALADSQLFQTLFGVALFGYVMIILGTFVVTFVIIVQRFYKNLTGVEGYLMHTLPVNTHQLLVAKLVTSVVWELASVIMVFISVFILTARYIFLPDVMAEMSEIFRILGIAFGEIVAEVGIMRALIVVLNLIALMLVGTCVSMLMIFAAISIGHTFKRRRVLGSVISYLGLTMIAQMVAGILGVGAGRLFETNFNIAVTPIVVVDQLNILMGLLLLGSLAFAGVWYFISQYVLSSQLNLE